MRGPLSAWFHLLEAKLVLHETKAAIPSFDPHSPFWSGECARTGTNPILVRERSSLSVIDVHRGLREELYSYPKLLTSRFLQLAEKLSAHAISPQACLDICRLHAM